jgi:hypothetical protein
MTTAIAGATPAGEILSTLFAAPCDADRHLAADIARRAMSDPANAAHLVHQALSSLPGGADATLALAIAACLEDHDLQTLARMPQGHGFLHALDHCGSSGAGGPEQRAQLERLRDARFGAAAHGPAEWAAAPLLHHGLQLGMLNTLPGGKTSARGESAAQEQVKSAFKEEFAAKAGNKQEFDAFLHQVYGDKYDKNLAEQYRQQALAGDFSFLPDVKFVDAATLQGGKGAYNEKEGVVYINKQLAASDPAKAAQVFVEEAGAHLDAKLNTVDTQGDEGEMFRRVLGGEHLSQTEIAAIRNDDDHGTITVDGKKVEVEFWFGEDFVDAAGKAVSDVADTVKEAASDVADTVKEAASDVADHVGTAARDMVYSVGDAVKEGAMGLVNTVEIFTVGLMKDVFAGFLMNALQGRFADAWDSVTTGLDKMFIAAPRRLMNAGIEAAGNLIRTCTYVLPPKAGGNLMREVVDRGVDSVRTVANAAIDVARNIYRLPFEIAVGVGKDMGEALKYWARGDFRGGAERFGMAYVHPFERVVGAVVDSGAVVAQGAGNVVGNVLGLHEPARGLSKAERDYLQSIYGTTSLNLEDMRIHRNNVSNQLGMMPHTVGNDMYLPESCFNSDGSLNQFGMETLAHEAFHVYQAQHGGNDYIDRALGAQLEGVVEDGNWKAGYDWVQEMRTGKPFNEWNAEAQAKYIETLAKAKTAMGADRTGDGVPDLRYDLNNNGEIEANELELAWVDKDNDGVRDVAPAGSPPGTPDPEAAVNLTADEFQSLMATWDAIKSDRPDRTVI